jgi:hypothetical protein
MTSLITASNSWHNDRQVYEMALSEFEAKRIEKEVDAFMEQRRPPVHVRPELDLGYRIKGQSVEIFEVRPLWNNPAKKIEEPVAKATYVKAKKVWRVYWQRADLKWHRYEPDPEVDSLQEFLGLVDRDEYACFFG